MLAIFPDLTSGAVAVARVSEVTLASDEIIGKPAKFIKMSAVIIVPLGVCVQTQFCHKFATKLVFLIVAIVFKQF